MHLRFAVRLSLVFAVMCFLRLLSATDFPKMPTYLIGPHGVSGTGDFNGDGKLDLIGLNQCSPTPCSNSTITVSLGYGNGQFRRPVTSVTEGFPDGLFGTGDFNGDHKLDLAFLSFPPGQSALAVMLGNGDGTFGATMIYPVPYNSSNLVVGDVNGDGKLDLVMAEGVFLGNGDGTFRALPPAARGSAECFLADVNHDGKLDLIGGSLQLGNGDGTFQDAQMISGPGNCPLLADFDGDGNLDIATPYLSGVNLYYGNGDGTFRPPVYRWTSPDAYQMLVGDFNGDGKPDLLALRGSEIDVLLNTGKGTFRPGMEYLSPGGVILGDFNGDGRTDMMLLHWETSGNIFVIPAFAQPGGTFSLPRSFYLPGGTGSISLMAGDLNNDGNLDLVELNLQSPAWLGGHLNRLLGNGDGTFKTATDLLTGGRNSYVGTLADLNGDGKLDVLVGSGDSINVRLGLGDGNFQNPLNSPFQSGWMKVAVADFNGDGIPDVAMNTSSSGPGMILLGNGDGTFRKGASLLAQFSTLVAGDFNGDGKQDLGVATTTGVGVLLGNGDGTFQPISVLRAGYTQFLLAGDFNLDGKLDLAAVGTSTAENTFASIYLGNGDGTLQPTRNVWVKGSTYPGGLVAADFNADGKLDLAVSLYPGDIAVLTGDGTGAFQSPKLYFGGGGGLVAGDFDGNGTQDLAVITSERTVAILLNK